MKRTLRQRVGRVETVRLADLKEGPIRHVLSAEQEARIRAFHETFIEVFPCTLEKALDGFRRDMHPDDEIAIWERMADVYQRHVASCKTSEARKALFANILRTGQPPS